MLLLLSKRDVEQLLPVRQCIDLMEEALASLARGEVLLPLRQVLRIPDSANVFALMPAYSKAMQAIGAKLITVYPANQGTELDSHQGVVLLFDGARGNMLAMMDAASITAIRTAAVSGVATRLLANPDAGTLAILGSGVQARTHLAAMMAVRPITRVLVWSRDSDHARALVKDFDVAGAEGEAHVEMTVVDRVEDAVRAADVVCTVTASPDPLLRGEWLRAGAHVNAVGASVSTSRELDSEAVRRARLFVDRRESALAEAGDVLVPVREGVITADHIVAELGELIANGAAGRVTRDEITLFKSLGIAIEDLACAHYLHERAKRDHSGTWIEF